MAEDLEPDDNVVNLNQQKIGKAEADLLDVTGAGIGHKPEFRADDPMQGAVLASVRKILSATDKLFARNGRIERINHQPWAGTKKSLPKNADSTPNNQTQAMAVALNASTAKEAIERHTRWRRLDKAATTKAGHEVTRPCPVPEWAAKGLVEGTESDMPNLNGVIRHPILLPDGTILSDAHGFDPETQSWIDAEPVEVADLKGATPEDSAKWLIGTWLAEFPFAANADAARAVAYALTLLARRAVLDDAMAPMYMVTAPEGGTGKSELIEVITLGVLGCAIPFYTFPKDDEQEMAKLLTTLALSDPTAFSFDNLENGWEVRSARLDQLITRGTLNARKLGTMDEINIPFRAVVTMTGNNITVTADMATRTLEIRLEAKLANPHLRSFKRDIRAWTKKKRGEILAHLVNVASIEPGQRKTRFPEWHALIAHRVIEATGETGLLDAWSAIEAGDEGGTDLTDLLERMDAVQRKAEAEEPETAPVWLSSSRCFAIAGEATVAIARLKPETTTAARITDKTLAEAGDAAELLTESRIAARRVVSKDVTRALRKLKGKAGGGFRLRERRVVDGKGRPTFEFRAEKMKAAKPPAE